MQQCRCAVCGDADGTLPCEFGFGCGKGFTLVDDFCVPCGGADQPLCCDRVICGDDNANESACKDGLFLPVVPITGDKGFVREDGTDALCSSEAPATSCGLLDQPPCQPEDPAQFKCLGLTTPSEDGLVCVPCGRIDMPVCLDRFKFCTGTLAALYDEEGNPTTCYDSSAPADGDEGADEDALSLIHI